MKNWNLRQISPALTFVSFVFMAQVVLPWKNTSEWGPFFDWSLFSKSSVHWNFYDLEVQGTRGLELYSSSSLKKSETWYNLQRLASQVAQGEPITEKDFLFSHLKSQGLTPLRIYKIKLPLAGYILLNPKEKYENVDEIFRF